MEQAKRGTPNEKQQCESPLARSPWMRGTPVKRNDVRATLKRLTYQNNAQCFAVLSNYMTPPTKLRKFINNNPFEPDLINSLHLSAISPTVFTKVSSPMKQSPSGFAWSIEELAHMKPAKIEESAIQQVCSPDPETEMRAQAAIDRFFKETHIPSPWDIREKMEGFPLNDLNSTQELSKSTKDAWSQTVLSLPLNLPQNVEEALKPFCTFTQEQNADRDDVNSSNSSLRRKLFLCHDEGTDNESIASLSPIKMALPCSPPESGMIDGALLKLLQTRRRSRGSSVVTSEELSPNISPIHNADRLHERIEYCSRTATRLNFTVNMSTDDIIEEKRSSSVNGYYLLDMTNSENHVKRTEDNDEMIIVNNDKTNACDSINMEELPNCTNSTDNTTYSDAIVFSDKEYNNEISSLKVAPETASFSREDHKWSNIMSGAFEQQNISNSVQDTGYQTHSMSSTLPTIDNYNTSTNYKTLCNERMTSKENAQLSWRESIRFSSTPSKYNKENESLESYESYS
ncbi:protein aurora borealis isoform X2 [Solenopsis invicta]|uniref:protein aurora borealis isoform X2 n=1 Tax=Solenopsis invicta TaxID=13686 RepID=UPI000E340454|nr:protein aurora borealis isoform X2 [Solenopsis invicta]